MAFRAVVIDGFTQKTVEALRKLQREHGALALAVMTPSDLDAGQTWTAHVAAAWLDSMGLTDGIRLLRAFFQRELGAPSNRVRSASAIRMNSGVFQTFASKFDIPTLGTAYRVIGLDLDHFDNDDAVLFLACPARAAEQLLTA